jgi:hypothetical protein
MLVAMIPEKLLAANGWINPIPYVLRALGTNAFVFAGRYRQRIAAAASAVSSLALTGAWITIFVGAW